MGRYCCAEEWPRLCAGCPPAPPERQLQGLRPCLSAGQLSTASIHPWLLRSGEVVELATPRGLHEAAAALGLSRALGFMRMLQLGPDDLTTLPEPGYDTQPKP